MNADNRTATASYGDALRTLVADARPRDAASAAVDRAVGGKGSERARIELLAVLNGDAIRRSLQELEERGSYSYGDTNGGSARAHRKVAALQDLLGHLGLNVGPMTRGLSRPRRESRVTRPSTARRRGH